MISRKWQTSWNVCALQKISSYLFLKELKEEVYIENFTINKKFAEQDSIINTIPSQQALKIKTRGRSTSILTVKKEALKV